MSLVQRVAEAIEAADSLLCLGLDPASAKSAAAAERECQALLEATVEHVCAVKPNIAFFERFGSRGLAVLERICRDIPEQKLLILDAKRGDIGHTAEAYAAMAFDHFGADAVTVNPLMGHDSLKPFLERYNSGCFVITRTSNPGAADFLRVRLQTGERLYERIVDSVMSWNPHGAAGFVVGATDAIAIDVVRHRAPEAPLLLPGVGAQGGDLEATVIKGMDRRGGGAIIPLSRGIAESATPGREAKILRARINGIRRVHRSAVSE